jgi:hypothetical protein
MIRLIATFAAVVFASVAMRGQVYPTSSILFRTVMVEFNHMRGTSFSIDVNGREYWITAKHVLTGAKHPPYGSVIQESVAGDSQAASGEPTSSQRQFRFCTGSAGNGGRALSASE